MEYPAQSVLGFQPKYMRALRPRWASAWNCKPYKDPNVMGQYESQMYVQPSPTIVGLGQPLLSPGDRCLMLSVWWGNAGCWIIVGQNCCVCGGGGEGGGGQRCKIADCALVLMSKLQRKNCSPFDRQHRLYIESTSVSLEKLMPDSDELPSWSRSQPLDGEHGSSVEPTSSSLEKRIHHPDGLPSRPRAH